MEVALDWAVHLIRTKNRKLEKKKYRSSSRGYKEFRNELDNTCELEEARSSPILHSQIKTRLKHRREAVCEKSETERLLVKETLKQFVISHALMEYRII